MGQEQPFEALDLVCLLAAFRTDQDEEVPADTFGTVVVVHAGEGTYRVEFVAGLATVEADRLAVAQV